MQLIHLLSGMINNLNQLTRLSYINSEVSDLGAIWQIQEELRVVLLEEKIGNLFIILQTMADNLSVWLSVVTQLFLNVAQDVS